MKRPVFKSGCDLTCKVCGVSTPRNSNKQLYCPTCSAEVSKSRYLGAAAGKRRAAVKTASRIAGEARNGAGRVGWTPADVGTDLEWSVRVSVPFTYSFSKNAVWSTAKGGHVFMRAKSRTARGMVTDVLRSSMASAGIVAVEAKVYVDIFVQKSNHKGDAINVIDVVCDGIKDAIGVDDRWFCIKAVDWEIVKSDPRIFIGVGQATLEHHRVCSYCGAILPLGHFNKRKNNHLGVDRVCRSCKSTAKVIE